MRSFLLLITALSTSYCSEELILSGNENRSNEPRAVIKAEDVQTYEELRSYLDQRYGEVEEMPVTALISSGMDTSVSFKYRLQDNREITVPIIFTASNERIVDPEFDLESLPN